MWCQSTRFPHADDSCENSASSAGGQEACWFFAAGQMSPSDQIKPAGSDLKQLGNGRILAFRHVAPNHNGPGKAVGGEVEGRGVQIPPRGKIHQHRHRHIYGCLFCFYDGRFWQRSIASALLDLSLSDFDLFHSSIHSFIPFTVLHLTVNYLHGMWECEMDILVLLKFKSDFFRLSLNFHLKCIVFSKKCLKNQRLTGY